MEALQMLCSEMQLVANGSAPASGAKIFSEWTSAKVWLWDDRRALRVWDMIEIVCCSARSE
jgi:flagellar basal body L-ring protein FlgH